MGKGRGAIGNVILQTYNSKTIARHRNETISVPQTDEQIKQGNRIYNCSNAINFLLYFLRDYKAYNQKGLSTFAYIVKLTAQSFTSFRSLRNFQAIRQLADNTFGNPKTLNIIKNELIFVNNVKVGVRISFYTEEKKMYENLLLSVMVTNITISHGTLPISSVKYATGAITLFDIKNGYIDILIANFDTQFIIAYSRLETGYSSNIRFSQIFN